ncbi:MAG: hypothetical protein ACW97Z_11440 [Candidatus Hodarchaeales archaeon]|jgi:hypothetical protein
MYSEIKLFGPQIHSALENLVILSQTLEEHSSLKSKVFSHGKAVIGPVDFIFEWTSVPSVVELLELVSLIDESLVELKTRYTITTMESTHIDIENLIEETPNVGYSLFKFYGPSISKAVDAMTRLVGQIPILKEGTLDNKPLTLIGEFDFAIQWIRYPETDEIISLLKEVDNVLETSGVWYTVTTKGHLTYRKDDSEALLQIQRAKEEAEGEARKVTRFA